VVGERGVTTTNRPGTDLPQAAATVAPAKVNATLVVGPTREADGRHELVSVMQSVTLHDDVAIRPRRDGDELPPRPGETEELDPELLCVLPAGTPTEPAAGVVEDPSGDLVRCPGVRGENLALTALRRFRAATGWDAGPLTIEIAKRIPVAAGMAGGSADAGAVLRLAAHLSGRGDAVLLQELAAGLGADVPHQLQPGLALATGAGERLVRSTGILPGAALVLPSSAQLSTAAVYRRCDELDSPRTATALAGWEDRVAIALGGPAPPSLPDALCVNDLEAAALDLCPSIADALDRLRGVGAQRSMVCGSGPTTIGWFASADAARAAATALGEEAGAIVAVPTGGAAVSSILELPA
jgi:4-diphosphocytidyl-2-C-methyl-D-erythritol kinase